ncbi:phthiocerol/phenolphthiocerol synthesis type-I polyketide synthase A/phthiocerol/phenolphthiocerol synthesis type-I polyketide synthase B [Amycolatopsis xylanica]|uniref:Phthiocerol/phenolphthiocerol synthesis type-I polyketide synthase A/phthiocerol/phenolphthiocerol synthesis type-I polyketide synthase B n=1 Tax=Amycolatopsis xylanica TaxID=589385 RepID=A0A1H3MX94_9PSEU|nr:type I polyketide synthase [Amycolatopsis xylanica]SDY81301.1 phthiocerol/phenolphthiocerol synthesis type-I polyketide synthase A/phthiocerol/phenolphthiocerol synthesis type-I polyketide synthase B [Amycolatopsis xylanica]
MTTEELARWLTEQLAELCDLDFAEIDPAKPFGEYGLSSRRAVELAGELEDMLDVALPTTLIWEHPTIERLAKALTGETEAPRDEPAASADEPIAVIGLGCRLPGGIHGPEQFWRLLTEGLEAISEVPQNRWDGYENVPEDTTRWGGFLDDIAGFDAEFFGIAPREAARMDPQQRMVLEVAWEALEHAGIAPRSLGGSRTGVFVGVSGTEYSALSLADVGEVDAWAGTGSALAIAANRLSYALDLRGPSMAVDTACSSSLTSVHLAVQSLRSGESDAALAGGANLLLGPGVTANFDQMGILSKDGRCKPFAAGADGIARAEGAGIVVLKRLSDARADGDRVLAVIRGTATNSDGRSNGLTAPNPEAQQALLHTAYRRAGIDPSTVDYVEAHGTGTLLGDPIEAGALGAILGTGRPAGQPLLVGSVKSNLGHLEAAAGITGLIKVVLSLQHKRIPATLNFDGPNPHIPFDELRLAVADTARPWPEHDRPALAGVSGFGFGGTNAHVILEQDKAGFIPERDKARFIPVSHGRFLLSAANEDRLREAAGHLAAWVDSHDAALADVEHTLARRLGGKTRTAVVARTRDELVSGLRGLSLGEHHVTTGPLDGDGPVFVFSGHGAQWAGMGRRLLTEEPAFAAAVARLDPLIHGESGFSLRTELQAGAEAATMDHVQPLVFGIQVALAELWRSHGVTPAAVIGHSFGEVAAAVVAGAISEADGAKIVALRSRLLASLAGDGAMALLELGAAEAAELVAGVSDVDIAVLSAPRQTVIAGRAEQVKRIVSTVEERGLLARLVNLDVAAHSPIVDRVTGTLIEGLGALSAGQAGIRFYGTALDDPRRRPDFDARYWAANLRQPVRFAGAVEAAVADGYRAFIEVSPHPVLRHALLDNLAARGHAEALVLSTLKQCEDETTHFHTQLAAWELATTPVDRPGQVIDLPTTAWRHVRHWLPVPKPRCSCGTKAPAVALPEAETSDSLLTPRWRPTDTPQGKPPASIALLGQTFSPLGIALRNYGIGAEPESAEAVVVLLPDDDNDPAGALAAAERAILTVSEVVRRCADSGKPPRLLLATTGAAAVTEGEAGMPAFAALRGLVRVLGNEHPELRSLLLDCDPASAPEERARRLLAELSSGKDDEVAWRAGQRHARRLERVTLEAPTRPVVRADGSYVVTGGLGGIGLFVASWLASQGARRLVLNGRSAPQPEARRELDRLATSTEIVVVLGDIAEPGVAERLITAAGPNLRGVLHAAAVFDDRTTARLDAATLHKTWAPKAYGAWRLHEATVDLDLDWWVGFSSIAGLLGFFGQPAYATANAYLDALVTLRRAQGLPATSIAWGTWADVGKATSINMPGLRAIRPDEGIAVLAGAAGANSGVLGWAHVDETKLVAVYPQLAEKPFCSGLLSTTVTSGWAGPQALASLPAAQAREAAGTQLRTRIASVLGFAPATLDTTTPLIALGVDSLLAVRIRNAVQYDFGIALPVALLLRGASAGETEDWLFGELGIGGELPRMRTRQVLIGPRDAAERLVTSVWRDVLGIEVGVTQDFYGIGGTRAKAEEVTAMLVKRSGRELTISELFEHPSIERMAAHLREEDHGGVVRTLRAEGSRTPLFFFHPSGGDTAVYQQLTDLLEGDFPVYGFDRLDGVSSVEDRIERYLPELRAIQPHGPYRLAGWSFGGCQAFEAAQRLRREGEQVELLGLIDPIIPLPIRSGLSEVELLEKRFERFEEFVGSCYGREITLPYAKMARLGDEEQVELLIAAMRDEGLVNSAVSDAILTHQRTSFLDSRALERYVAQAYDGPAVYFSAAEPVPGGLRDERFDRMDPARGWDEVCSRLDVLTVPGHHLSLLDPPNVDVIGEHLNGLLASLDFSGARGE